MRERPEYRDREIPRTDITELRSLILTPIIQITADITVVNAQRMTEIVLAQQHEESMQMHRQTIEKSKELIELVLRLLPQNDRIATELGRTSTPTPQQLMEAGQHVSFTDGVWPANTHIHAGPHKPR